MDITTLKVFQAVAETRSFSQAADQIFLTQPAVSKRIAALEHELGIRLFDRIGRQVHLTEGGRILLSRTRSILGEIQDTRRELANLSGEISGTLNMATSHHIGLHRLPPALARFHKSYPNIPLNLRFMDSESGCSQVAHGKLELAVITLPIKAPLELAVTKIWEDPLEIVIGHNHPLAQVQQVSIPQLLKHPAVLPGHGTVTRELIFSALGQYREKLEIGMATNYLEVLKMLAIIGLGWTALPHTMIDADLYIVHAKGMTIRRQLGIVVHRARTLSNAAQAMINIIEQTAA